ncbi:MAG: indolepyruvate oxidoreductase subunit beta [Oscillospiraceae bacterium]|nr:indolepyruvate oxidoreductase subunit beta [Oscillospiraceae bacterium]
MNDTKNILIVGVGGQGTLLASKLMGKVYAEQGFDVKVSEVHGMSQRGGSVVTYVRYGTKVWSSLIDKGEADVILSFEQLEAARWLEYLKPDGKIITNTKKIDPMPVILGAASYPDGVIEKLRALVPDVTAVDADALAEKAGSVRATNLVLLGVFAKSSGIDKAVWLDAIRSTVPPKTVETNEKAFELGWQA